MNGGLNVRNLFSGKEIIRFSMPFLLAGAIAALTGCGGAGSGAAGTSAASGVAATAPASGVAATTVTAASLTLSASPTTVKTDGGATSTTITVTALNAANAVVPNVIVTMSADTGILGAGAVTTGATGMATTTFSSGASRFNRTATITATAGAVSAQLPVQIVGSTVTVNSSGATLPDNGTLPVTLTITPKDASNNIVLNAAVTLTKTGGTGTVTFTPASGTTDSTTGIFTSVVTGAGAGAVTVSAAALGATGTTALTVSPSAATFGIDQQTLQLGGVGPGTVVAGNPNPTAMKIGDKLVVWVNAPGLANVNFATTTGVWNGGGTTATVSAAGGVVCSGLPATVAGKACATLTTTQAGVATVQVYDPLTPATSASLTVGMTSAIAASITLQPSPSVVSKSVGTTTGSSTLIAMVRGAGGAPVGDAPVAFSVVNPTGGGETVSPVVVLSAATTAGGLNLGEARTSFTSGTSPSGAGGVQIRASVVGTAVATNLAPSGNDATIVIGGTAGSVAFGMATVIATDASNANYVRDMSVLVTDSNGNPAPQGTVVNLSAWPIAWSTGSGCVVDADTATTGTFYNEDINENLILDAGEDGARQYYLNGAPRGAYLPGGKVDGSITPPNSAGGSLPATVTTDVNGVAAFKLTYTKGSAIWIQTRIRGRAVVQGSETVGEMVIPLYPTIEDANPPTVCKLPPSPYKF